MPAAERPTDEARRMAALRQLGVLDTTPEEEFDALVRAAALVCDAPISLLSLVDDERQWFKARVGLEARETHRDLAFCAHAIHDDALFEVPDTARDARFVDNALVTGDPRIRFYAGVPLTLSGGERVGTLCVIDRRPRALDPRQQAILRHLATAAVRMLERRRVAVESKLAELRFRAVSDASPLAVFAAGHDGKVVYANAAWDALFGPGDRDDRLARVASADRDRVTAAWNGEDHPRAPTELAFSMTAPDGSVRQVRALWRTARDEHGVGVGRTGIVEDVTDRLDAAVALRSANAELAAQNDRKNHFIATLAHELRNPLAAIRNGASLLRLAQLPAERAANVVAMVSRQTAVMTAIVDDLMDTSAIGLGKVTLCVEAVDLAAVVGQAVEASLPAIEARSHELRLDLGQEPVVVQGDFARLVQVVGNLVTNAAKYTPPGGHVDLRIRRDADHAFIDVADDGEGLDAADRDAVFGLFEQGARTDRTERTGGLGIGLALARQLCELHGGTLTANSAGKGLGSCFTVAMPMRGGAGARVG